MIFFLLRFAVTALMLADSGYSRPGDFKIIGPGGGGAMFHPTISPPRPKYRLVELRHDRVLYHLRCRQVLAHV